MNESLYHSALRIAAVVCAFLLVFDSGLVHESTSRLSSGTQVYVATAIGVGAGVEPTPLNQWTAELTTRERELEAREAALVEREIEVGVRSGDGTVTTDYSTYALASILFILLLLILLNYTLDYIRIRETPRAPIKGVKVTV